MLGLARRISIILSNEIKRLSRLRLSHLVTSVRSFRIAGTLVPGPRTVLLVEPNAYHSETLPGYISLIAAAGYTCWLVVRPHADVDGAISRLPVENRAPILRMNLWAIAMFLRSKKAQQFDLIFFNSGSIAEPHGYFGGVLEYFGRLPSTRLGYLMIEHSDQYLRERRDWRRLDPERLFALTPVRSKDVTLNMLAPVELGRFTQPALKKPRLLVAVGRFSPTHRNLHALVQAVEVLRLEGTSSFKVIAIGAKDREVQLPESVRPHIELVGSQSFTAMYASVEAAHYFLPLLDSSINAHRTYLSGNTTGSRQLILGFEKIGIWETPFAEAYGFSEADAIVYAPGALADGMRRALALDPIEYAAKIEGVGRLKRLAFQSSLDNLRAFILAQERITGEQH